MSTPLTALNTLAVSSNGQGITSVASAMYPPPYQSSDESAFDSSIASALRGMTYVDDEGHSYNGRDVAYALGAICAAQPACQQLFRQNALYGEPFLKLTRALHIGLVGGEIATAAQYEALNVVPEYGPAAFLFGGMFNGGR